MQRPQVALHRERRQLGVARSQRLVDGPVLDGRSLRVLGRPAPAPERRVEGLPDRLPHRLEEGDQVVVAGEPDNPAVEVAVELVREGLRIGDALERLDAQPQLLEPLAPDGGALGREPGDRDLEHEPRLDELGGAVVGRGVGSLLERIPLRDEGPAAHARDDDDRVPRARRAPPARSAG